MKRNTGIWTVAGVAGLMVVLLIFPARLRAQVATGTISGTVKDPSGAVVPGVSISVKSVATGAMRKTMTDSSGRYQVPALPPGAYNVEASVKGFATSVRSGTVTVSATVTVDFTLTVGNVTQRVQVTGAASQLNTTNASMGGLVGGTAIRQLPLNGRDWLQLATLQPGVVGGIGQVSSSDAGNDRASHGNGESLAISGNRPQGNLFLVDGLVVNDQANASPGSGLNVNLGVEAIGEFRVLTDEYTAEYGRSTGGVVTAALKSGTNQFHGDVYEFLRNSALDARNFFDTTKPPFVRNQFGGSAGGPIKKNKTFIFGDFEEFREVKGLAHSSDTLSLAARQGQLTTGPVTIAPSVQPYLAFFPLPNGPVTGDTAKFNFAGGLVGNEEYTVVKVDQNFSDRTTLSGSFQFDNATNVQPDPYDQKLTGSPSRHYNSAVTLTHVFSPTFLNTALVGVSRSHSTDALDTVALNPIAADTSLGFLPGLPAGVIGVAGLTGTQGGMGGSGADIFNYTSFQGSDDATWMKGRNTFKFGAMVQRIRYNKNSVIGSLLGEFDFNTIADFLQGIPAQFTSDLPGTNDIRGLRQTYAGLYFQDGIAVRPNLHVNAGMRYEYVTPITEQFGRGSFLPTLASPTPRLGGNYFNTNTKDFAPRVGIAWDPTGSGKTSIRAGFGIYDVLPFPYTIENRTNGPPFTQIGNVNSPPASSFPTGALAFLTPGSLRGVFVEQNPKRAYVQEWNFTIQRQLAANAVLSVGYVGSRANHLPRIIGDTDQVPFSLVTFAPNGQLLFPTTGPIQRINPNFGRIAATFWNGWSTYNSLVVDFSKRFSRGLGLGASYTWSKGLDIGSSTFGPGDQNNTEGPAYAFFPSIEKAPTDFDITHRFVLNYTWDIPTPSSFTGVSHALLGGWQLGGIFTAQTGPPFSVIMNVDQALTGDSQVQGANGGQRPNFNNIPGCSTNAINPGNPSNYIRTQCFSFPVLGQLGNLGRNTLRAPGLLDFDASLFKNWRFWRERMNLQFRAEFFNLFNRANFQEGKTDVFDSNGSVIPTAPLLGPPTLTDEREIQFALKLSW